MADIFGDNELIDINVDYILEKNKNGTKYVIILNEKTLEAAKNDETKKDKIKTLKTKWRSLTWQTSNELINRANVYNHHTQQQEIDWNKYRDAKVKYCLVDWDEKNEIGEPVPCTEANINRVHSPIILYLLKKYDDMTSIPMEEQSKNF